jgi:secretion/DNA translocation related TadE-like protein
VSRSGDRGSATVLAVVWMALLFTVVWIGLLAAAATARQHDLDGAADLVALSAAASLQSGGDPCVRAAAVAEANDVRLTECALIDADDVRVTLVTELRLPMGIDQTMRAQARAGP